MFVCAHACESVVVSELLPAVRVRAPLVSRTKSALLRELVGLAVPDADAVAAHGILAAVRLAAGRIARLLHVPASRAALLGSSSAEAFADVIVPSERA
mgnify:FL=1